MPQMELAARVGIEPPTLVHILDGLARSGFVQRRASTTDRRVKTVHLTAKAQRKLEQIEAVAHALRVEITRNIDTATLAATIAALESVKDRLMGMAVQEKSQTAARPRAKQRRVGALT